MNNISKHAAVAFFIFILYAVYTLNSNSYETTSYMMIFLTIMCAILTFVGLFIYGLFKNMNKSTSTSNEPASIEAFVDKKVVVPNNPVSEQPVPIVEKVVEPVISQKTESDEEQLKRAMAAINNTNSIDSSIKRNF